MGKEGLGGWEQCQLEPEWGPIDPSARLDAPGSCLRMQAKPDLPDTLDLHDPHCRPIRLR